MASTRYLPPGEELVLEGAFAIKNSTNLTATAEARDGRGNSYRNNTSLPIWMKSSRLNLSVSAPSYAHRGERIPLQIRMENRGDDDLAGREAGRDVGSAHHRRRRLIEAVVTNRLERAEAVAGIRQGMAEFERGEGQLARTALEALRDKLNVPS